MFALVEHIQAAADSLVQGVVVEFCLEVVFGGVEGQEGVFGGVFLQGGVKRGVALPYFEGVAGALEADLGFPRLVAPRVVIDQIILYSALPSNSYRLA